MTSICVAEGWRCTDVSAGAGSIAHWLSDRVGPTGYDLIHSRALLMHLDDPAEVVRRMARELAPGGWLLIEESDFRSCSAIDSAHPLAAGFNAANRTQALLDAGIIDLHLGGSLLVSLMSPTQASRGSSVARHDGRTTFSRRGGS